MGYARFRTWMRDAALPLWSSVGCDPDGLGFEEQLSLSGEREDVGYKRVRVQARQIYVFSHAHLLGWKGGLDAASRGYDLLSGAAARDGAWPRRLDRRGAVLDDTADLYDIAFVLFALAWFSRASGAREPLARAHATLDWLERHMASPLGGFFNTLPRQDEPRQQNPHMHLLEAALALYETSGEARFRELADRLIALFKGAFLDGKTSTLGEFFAEDWSAAPGARGDHIEPGHHYEWVWLLGRYEKAAEVDLSGESGVLYAFANAHGVDPRNGLAVDVVNRRGETLEASTRLWPQTEAIKAHIAQTRGEAQGQATGPIVARLFDRFLAPAPAGGWYDHFDARGACRSRSIPASSLYHLFMAFGEMARVMDARPEGALS
jgi:mannose/cellobiose epimerase-like protein (N-acyl-D-glucosamine 2-epimerase family)